MRDRRQARRIGGGGQRIDDVDGPAIGCQHTRGIAEVGEIQLPLHVTDLDVCLREFAAEGIVAAGFPREAVEVFQGAGHQQPTGRVEPGRSRMASWNSKRFANGQIISK